MEDTNIDYIEQYELLPKEVAGLIEEFSIRDTDYKDCKEIIVKLEKLGWTCDYDLSGELFDLKPINR